MNTRCYGCGYLLHDGIPPMEALSQDQAAVIGGVVDAEIRHSLLIGTNFEGMSTYSFCEFCLTALHKYVVAVNSKNNYPGHKMVWYGMQDMISCECGAEWNLAEIHPHRNPLGNRWQIRHIAQVHYDINYMTAVVNLPLGMGYEYGDYNHCDSCEEFKPSRGMGGGEEGPQYHVFSICEDCDTAGVSKVNDDLEDEEPF